MNLRSILTIGFLAVFLMAPMRLYAQQSVKETEELDFAQGLLSRGMYDLAIAQYQKFITDYPNHSSLQEAYLSLGEAYFLSQEFDKAINAFNQFNTLYPNSKKLPVSILRLGQIDIEQKKYDAALKELTSIDIDKQLKGIMLQSFDFYIAQAYLGVQDTASAMTFFQKAAQVQGASDYTGDAWEEIGNLETQNGRYPQALDAFTKAAQFAEDDNLKGELTYRVAEIQYLLGKYPDAIAGFGRVLDKYPDLGFNQEALANMLLSYFNLGQYVQLLQMYQDKAKAIKQNEAAIAIHFTAVLAYIELKKYDDANALLDRLLNFPSLTAREKTKIFIKQADILIRETKYKEGLGLLQAHQAEDPHDMDENLFLQAQAYYGLRDFDRAFNFFENVNLNFPGSRFFNAALLGEAHARQKAARYKEAELLFLKYYDAQDEPDLKSEALYDVIMMALKADDLNGTIWAAREYLKTFPDSPQSEEVLLILVDNYSKNNQAHDAVNLLQDYLAKAKSVQRPNAANFLLGFNQQLLGNDGEAIAAYKKVEQHQESKFYVAALKNLAIIYLSEKDFDQAKAYFDLLISHIPQNDLQVKTYIWVCNEYLKKQQYEDVLRIVDQAEKRFPLQELVEIKYFKAEALRGLGNCDEAIKNYTFVASSAQKDAFTGSAHIGYGLCLEKTKKFDEAKGEFQKSLDENADDYTVTAHARFEIASIDEIQNNFDEALKLYLLIATIYDDEHYCSQSLLRAAKIDERFKHTADALKLYSEILTKYNNSPAAHYAKQKVRLLK